MNNSIDTFFLTTLNAQERRALNRTLHIGILLVFVLLMLHCILTRGDSHFPIGFINLYAYVDVFIIVLCASFFGLIPALCLVVVLFAINSLVNVEFAYTSFGMLIAVLTASVPIRFRWYETKRMTVLAALLFALAGTVWGFLLGVVQQNLIRPRDCLIAFCNVLVPAGVAVTLCHLFFTRASEELKLRLPMGIYYSQRYKAYEQVFSYHARSRLQLRVLCIIVIEALVLTVAAVVFANMLLPQLDVIFLRARRGKRFVDFIINKSTIAFDIKLFLLMTNVTVPLTIIANNFAQNSIVFPVRLMAKAMKDFMRNTTEQTPQTGLNIDDLPIRSRDEIGALYDSLKVTARNLTMYIEKIGRETQLELELAAAQAANSAKTTFLSNMSHEIRTPINAVLGMDEMILRESHEEATLRYAADIKSAGTSLLSLINDILDFNKIEAGKMEIIPVQYELSSAINDLVNMTQKRADDKGLQLHINVAKDTPHKLFGDDVRIKQVVLNILTNAVKYTNTGSVTMNVGWRRDGDEHIQLSFQVIDTGIGIKQEDLPKLFSAFERIEEERNRTIEGTGLGMNIVQQLLSMMGSRLNVKSEYGKGSDFSFEVRQKVLNWEPIGDFTEMYRKSLAANSEYHECFHAPDASILIVDDTKLNLTVIKGLLKQTQLHIDTAESGQETLELVKKRRYDVIFIDHRMPIMDGIETLHAMRGMEDNLNEGVPCVALTANAIQGAREMYLAEGFTDYLSKPVDGAKLEQLLIQYLPQEKVILAGSAGFTEMDVAASNAATVTAPADDGGFPALDGINTQAALKNCGDADILREAMQEFYATIAEKSTLIEQYAASGDWKNYTVLVHALKSSARLIGAEQLSADALVLEAAGDKQDEAQIRAATPALLALYRSYQQKLAPLVTNADDDARNKPLIDAEMLQEALGGIKEFVTAFDFDSADQIAAMLNDYQLPDAEQERYKLIKKHLAAVNREELLKLL